MNSFYFTAFLKSLIIILFNLAYPVQVEKI